MTPISLSLIRTILHDISQIIKLPPNIRHISLETPEHNALSPYELEHIIGNADKLHAVFIKSNTFLSTNGIKTESYAVLALFNESLHNDNHILMPNCFPIAKFRLETKGSHYESVSSRKDIIFNALSQYANILTLKGTDVTIDILPNHLPHHKKDEYLEFILEKFKIEDQNDRVFLHNGGNKILFQPGKLNPKIIDHIPITTNTNIIHHVNTKPKYNQILQHNILNEPINRFHEAVLLFLLALDFPDILSGDTEQQLLFLERMTHPLVCAIEHNASLSHAADFILSKSFQNKQFNQFMSERSINFNQIQTTCQTVKTNYNINNKLQNASITQIEEYDRFFAEIGNYYPVNNQGIELQQKIELTKILLKDRLKELELKELNNLHNLPEDLQDPLSGTFTDTEYKELFKKLTEQYNSPHPTQSEIKFPTRKPTPINLENYYMNKELTTNTSETPKEPHNPYTKLPINNNKNNPLKKKRTSKKKK